MDQALHAPALREGQAGRHRRSGRARFAHTCTGCMIKEVQDLTHPGYGSRKEASEKIIITFLAQNTVLTNTCRLTTRTSSQRSLSFTPLSSFWAVGDPARAKELLQNSTLKPNTYISFGFASLLPVR